jgi:hypothetical protein
MNPDKKIKLFGIFNSVINVLGNSYKSQLQPSTKQEEEIYYEIQE